MKANKTKRLASILAILTAVSCVAPAVSAAAPTVSTDETVYVNLDHYGKTEEVNVVKGCSPNGLTEFTDYGSYTKVKNMSNDIQPILTDHALSWKLTDKAERFYYECTPKNGVVLPWDFDISYKLNGVPADPKALAGASGLIEIEIKAIPNENAADYYKNNMLLEIMATVDMQDNLSIEAPGAQLQSMGGTTAAIFAALPGQEGDFVIRIGSEHFEMTGITMMMEPAKMSQLQDVKELKEAKDTAEDSVDAIYNSLNEMLESMQGMKSGIRQVQSGLTSLDQARETIDQSQNSMQKQADQSLDDMKNLMEQTNAMIPHLQTGQQMVEDVNQDLNQMVSTINQLKPHLDTFRDSITRIQKNTHKIQNALGDLQDASKDVQSTMKDLSAEIKTAKDSLKEMEKVLDTLAGHLADLQTSLGNLQPVLEDSLTQALTPYFATKIGEVAQQLIAQGMPADEAQQKAKEIVSKQQQEIMGSINGAVASLNGILQDAKSITQGLSDACTDGRKFLNSADSLTVDLRTVFDALEDTSSALKNATKELDRVGNTTQQVLDLSKMLIDNTTTLNNTINQYKDETVSTLKDMETLMGQLTTTMTSAHTLLTEMNDMLKASKEDLNQGAQQSIQGMQDLLNQALKSLDSTQSIQEANDTIKSTLDEQMDKFEKENKFLEIDPDAPKISFTSERNPEPDSLQVILRTEEISTGTESTDITEIEPAEEEESLWSRICQVFQKIWNAIVSIFSEE